MRKAEANPSYDDFVCLNKRSIRDRIYSSKIGSISVFYVLLCVGIVLVLYIWSSPELQAACGLNKESSAAVLSTILLFLVGGIAKLYDLADQRLGTVDLFLNEIFSVYSVIYSCRVFEGLIRQYYNPVNIAYPEAMRKENYVVMFEKHSKELGFLSRPAIAYVTAFYTLFKGSRDQRGALELWRDYEENNNNIRNKLTEDQVQHARQAVILSTVFVLFLALEAGYYAIRELGEREEITKWEPMLLRNLSIAYFFLLHVLDPDRDRERWQRLAGSMERRKLFDEGNQVVNNSKRELEGLLSRLTQRSVISQSAPQRSG